MGWHWPDNSSVAEVKECGRSINVWVRFDVRQLKCAQLDRGVREEWRPLTFRVNCCCHPDSVEMTEHDSVDVLDGKTSGVKGSDHRRLMGDRLRTGTEEGVGGTTRVDDNGPTTGFDDPRGLTYEDVTFGCGPIRLSPSN